MQLTFGEAEGCGQRQKTRRELFLSEMDHVVPWKLPLADRAALFAFRPAWPLVVPAGDLLQQWYALSDPAPEEALYDAAAMRRFVGISRLARIPEETTLLNFHQLLETHGLAADMLETVNAHVQCESLSLRAGTIVDAAIIHASSSTKEYSGQFDQ